MYNRYVPQGDGSFQRSTVPEPPRPAPRPVPPPEKPVPPPPPMAAPAQPEVPSGSCREGPPGPEGSEAQRFLARLLPRNMDTGDLLMLLILLLLLNDGSSEAPPALLTLALYFLLKPEEDCGT